jgi:hypothetical protein
MPNDFLSEFGSAAAPDSRSLALTGHPMEFTHSVLSSVRDTENGERTRKNHSSGGQQPLLSVTSGGEPVALVTALVRTRLKKPGNVAEYDSTTRMGDSLRCPIDEQW